MIALKIIGQCESVIVRSPKALPKKLRNQPNLCWVPKILDLRFDAPSIQDAEAQVWMWPVASFRCAAEFGHYDGTADCEQDAP
jgi:hypothetical protein